MKVGDEVIVSMPSEEEDRCGKIIVMAEPYCIVVIKCDKDTDRVTCRLDQVRKVVP